MSFKEEEERNKTCPSRGLGIAAAAIGVGVGAALYYFFSNRNETPAGEGATTSRWQCEEPHVLDHHDSDASYYTVSEHSTSDTSMDSSDSEENWQNDSFNALHSIANHLWTESDNYSEDPISESDVSEVVNISSDSETRVEWDVTSSSLDVPMSESPLRSPIARLIAHFTARLLALQCGRVDRERSWSLEECSICFDVMLRDQEVMSLECTHRFHQACILPWLREKQTCPNCRKAF